MSSVYDLPERIQEVERLLSKPTATPNEFSSWIIKWLTNNIDISTYQLRGLADTFFKAAPHVTAAVSTSSLTFVDLGGPTLTGLRNGKYLTFWGANMRSTNADSVGQIGVSPNGGTPSDSHVAKGRSGNPAEVFPIVYAREYELLGNDDNTLKAMYMRQSGDAPQFSNRWLVAVQTAK